MFVSDWMTRKVVTVVPDDSVAEAARLMKDKSIKHLPVMKGDSLRGIVSDRDIKEYIPSKASSLDVYELHYLLQKTHVKEIMKSEVVTAGPDTPIEEASMLLYDLGVGCLPVLEGRKLVGIISDRDIFRVLIDITGVRHGGHRIALTVEDRPGSIREAADIIRKHGFSLQGLLTSYEKVKRGERKVVIRTKGAGDFRAMRVELEGTYAGVRVKKG